MESILEKKKGAMSGGVIALIALVVVLVLGFGGFYGFQQTQQPVDDSGTTTGEGCNNAPYAAVSANDAINTGTTVSMDTLYARLDGQYIGSIDSDDTFNKGNEISILAEKSGYLDKIVVENKALDCGRNSFPVDVYASTAGSMKFSNENNNVLTDDASADPASDTTQEASSTLISIDGEIQSNADESSGEMVVVVEASNDSQVDSITATGGTSTETPELYSSSSANSKVEAFKVDELTDGEKGNFDISLSPESGQEMANMSVYVTAYGTQDAVDQDGSFIQNAVEDSDGNAVYETSFDSDFCIGDCSA